VENHIDVYHLWYLHSRSLSMYEHRRFRWETLGDNWWSHEPLRDLRTAPETLQWVPAEQRTGMGAHLLFPNLMLVTTGEYFATYDAVPTAPDRTRLTLRVRSVAETDGKPLIASIRAFMAEDVEICERLQEATASPHFAVGPTAAHHEEPIRRFHAALERVLRG
jgi:phenylpropionate dioxygenase-like ring-hydroxylating dioxygenase large terminal subunit